MSHVPRGSPVHSRRTFPGCCGNPPTQHPPTTHHLPGCFWEVPRVFGSSFGVLESSRDVWRSSGCFKEVPNVFADGVLEVLDRIHTSRHVTFPVHIPYAFRSLSYRFSSPGFELHFAKNSHVTTRHVLLLEVLVSTHVTFLLHLVCFSKFELQNTSAYVFRSFSEFCEGVQRPHPPTPTTHHPPPTRVTHPPPTTYPGALERCRKF